MRTRDVYTPWQEDLEDLSTRTVGRADLMASLTRSAEQLVEGNAALPVYLFGPRGCGKSHVLTLLKAQVAAMDLPVVFLPEDVPAQRTADELYARLSALMNPRPGWLGRIHAPTLPPRAVILVEALHKHLGAMNIEERRRLRARIEENQHHWWVCTGVGLPEALTQKEEPLFGAFNPYPIEALSADEGTALLGHIVPEAVTVSDAWPARAHTLVALAGGSPRTLVALGDACAAEPEAWASDHLHAVIRSFTAHYQMRFADLSADGQRVVEQLAQSERDLGPSEIGGRIGVSTAHASRVLLRLQHDGVLKSKELGRNTWYTLAEPLFRYWHEYRTSTWAESRIGWVGRLVEAILSPNEMARAWAAAQDDTVVRAIEAMVEKEPRKALPLIAHELGIVGTDSEGVRTLCKRLGGLPAHKLLDLATAAREPAIRVALRPAFSAARLDVVQHVWTFEATLRSESAAPAFRTLVNRLAAVAARTPEAAWQWVDERVSSAVRAQDQRGAAWSLDEAHTASLARLPRLRVRYSQHGKRSVDAPLLRTGDLLASGLPDLKADWSDLASWAQRRGDTTLWAAVVAQVPSFGGVRFAANPTPARLVPGLAPLWYALLRASLLARLTPASVALTWAAGAVALEEDEFASWMSAVAGGGAMGPTRDQGFAIEAALTRLAMLQPDRLAAMSSITTRLPWLDLPLARAAAVARTLVGEHLHPELQALRAALEG